jgi:hypothetical protein
MLQEGSMDGPDSRPVRVRGKERPRPERRRFNGVRAEAVRIRQLVKKFNTQLGEAANDEFVKVQVARAAELTMLAEKMRGAAIRGEPINDMSLVKLEGLASRAVAGLFSLGDRKHRRKVKPAPEPEELSLGAYIQQKKAEAEAEAAKQAAGRSGVHHQPPKKNAPARLPRAANRPPQDEEVA